MTLKIIKKPCKCCGNEVEVPTDNTSINCDYCGSSNRKNIILTDEEKYLRNQARMDKIASYSEYY